MMYDMYGQNNSYIGILNSLLKADRDKIIQPISLKHRSDVYLKTSFWNACVI